MNAPALATTRAELAGLLDARRRVGQRVGFVPTMGYLHAGHGSLIEAAAAACDHVTTTIFVNPLQFGAGEDLDRYPRTLDADVELAGKSGALLIRGTGEVRRVQGQVSRAELAGIGVNQSRYLIEIVPAVWYLTVRQDCRIFQDKSAKDIVTAVLAEHGQPAPKWGVGASDLKPIPYCTQFNETDLHFVSRLLEEHGTLQLAWKHLAHS